ncbi:hypothetical protein ANCDUO_19004 [Ancylostoma duodenale]|uniref:Transposable element Tc3 transposase-like DNA-binding HTH domain-containing protein n=1 Tax=Ancylostoma duodenale TaxID=51022 RepID=A0A0C2FWA1_9BILA|nr:hypothetical protein ANCDUO_19004 [Ancylostoma duodenale]
MKVDESLPPQHGCSRVATSELHIFQTIPRGTSPSTEKKAQIRLLKDAGLSGRAIGMKTGRTRCLVPTYLQNFNGFNKKKDTRSRVFSLFMTRGRSARKVFNSNSSLNQIRAELKLSVLDTTVSRGLHRNGNVAREFTKKASRLPFLQKRLSKNSLTEHDNKLQHGSGNLLSQSSKNEALRNASRSSSQMSRTSIWMDMKP